MPLSNNHDNVRHSERCLNPLSSRGRTEKNEYRNINWLVFGASVAQYSGQGSTPLRTRAMVCNFYSSSAFYLRAFHHSIPPNKYLAMHYTVQHSVWLWRADCKWMVRVELELDSIYPRPLSIWRSTRWWCNTFVGHITNGCCTPSHGTRIDLFKPIDIQCLTG